MNKENRSERARGRAIKRWKEHRWVEATAEKKKRIEVRVKSGEFQS